MCGVVWCKSRQILAISKIKFVFLQPQTKIICDFVTKIPILAYRYEAI